MGKCVSMKKNGFISMSLIYTFFLLFLTFITFLIISFRRENNLLDEYNKRIKESFLESDISDKRISVYIIKNGVKEKSESIPFDNYALVSESCNDGTIKYNNVTRKFKIKASNDTLCDVVFQDFGDVKIKMYYRNNETIKIMSNNFTYNCQDNNVNTEINIDVNGLNIVSNGANECKIYFLDEVGDTYENE